MRIYRASRFSISFQIEMNIKRNLAFVLHACVYNVCAFLTLLRYSCCALLLVLALFTSIRIWRAQIFGFKSQILLADHQFKNHVRVHSLHMKRQ